MQQYNGLGGWGKVQLKYRLCRCMIKINGIMKIEERTSTSILFTLRSLPGFLTLLLTLPLSGSDIPWVGLFLLSYSAQTSASPKLPDTSDALPIQELRRMYIYY